LLLLTHYLSLIFLRAWQKFIAEKEGEFNLTITFYTDYSVRNPNNNFRFEKIVGSMAHRRGVEYGTSYQFLKKQRNLNLSTSVAHLKQVFSTTRAH
jgi:hypothetical protein